MTGAADNRNPHGEFIWYELMTPDPDSAVRFYRAVLGWKDRSAGEEMGGYRILSTGGADVGGIMTPPSASGEAAAWVGYIGVDDVDAAAAAIAASGGAQHVPPTDIPGIGRFAMMADPQGAIFYIMRGTPEARSDAFAPGRTGHCQWNELETPDPQAAIGFYAPRFGWAAGAVMPMGAMGDYRFIEQDGRQIGAAMPQTESAARPAWRFYFGVADIDAAARAVSDNGGTIHHGPAQVPTGDFIVIAADPQGAAFGLSGPRKP